MAQWTRQLGHPWGVGWGVATEVLAHWSQQRRTVRQGFTALGISTVVGMAAGLVLGGMEAVLEDVRGLLVLVPAAIGMRGAVFGALTARLGTGMLTGQFTGELHRQGFTGQNVEAAVVLTFVGSAFAALAARAAAGAFGISTVSLWDLMTVSVVGGLLASVVVLAVVLVLARTVNARRWDMDAVGAPLVTAGADIATLPALLVVTLLLSVRWLTLALGVLLLVASIAAAVHGVVNPPDLRRRVVRESVAVVAYVAIVDILAGLVLEARVESFTATPALLVLVPPFIANCGSLGGILSARLGSHLHMGLLQPRVVPAKLARLEGTVTVLFAVVGFGFIGALAHAVSQLAGYRSPGLVALVLVSLVAGLVATALLFAVAYASAAATFQLGWDPDNYGIPIVSASMDLCGVLCLAGAIAVVRPV